MRRRAAGDEDPERGVSLEHSMCGLDQRPRVVAPQPRLDEPVEPLEGIGAAAREGETQLEHGALLVVGLGQLEVAQGDVERTVLEGVEGDLVVVARDRARQVGATTELVGEARHDVPAAMGRETADRTDEIERPDVRGVDACQLGRAQLLDERISQPRVPLADAGQDLEWRLRPALLVLVGAAALVLFPLPQWQGSLRPSSGVPRRPTGIDLARC